MDVLDRHIPREAAELDDGEALAQRGLGLRGRAAVRAVPAQHDASQRRERVELSLVRLEEVDPPRAELLLVVLQRVDGGLLRVEDRIRVARRAAVRLAHQVDVRVLQRRRRAEKLEDILDGRGEWQPAHTQHASVRRVLAHRRAVALARGGLLGRRRREDLDVAPAYLLVVGLQHLVELRGGRERHEGLSGGVVEHGDGVGREGDGDLREELADLLAAIAPRQAAQPRDARLGRPLAQGIQHGVG